MADYDRRGGGGGSSYNPKKRRYRGEFAWSFWLLLLMLLLRQALPSIGDLTYLFIAVGSFVYSS